MVFEYFNIFQYNARKFIVKYDNYTYLCNVIMHDLTLIYVYELKLNIAFEKLLFTKNRVYSINNNGVQFVKILNLAAN